MARVRIIALLILVLLGVACTQEAPTARPRPKPEPAQLDYLVRLTGGASASDSLPMIIAIHGLGDSPAGFFGLLAAYPGRARVILPAGPYPTSAGGHSWFQVHTRRGQGIWLSEPELIESTDRIAALVREQIKRHPTRGKPIVTGFSQGGILAFSLAARYPDLFCLAVPMGGLLPAGLRPDAALTKTTYPRIRALHGAADPLVPASQARATVAHLQAIGLDASLEEFSGVGHGVPQPVVTALYRLLAQGCD